MPFFLKVKRKKKSLLRKNRLDFGLRPSELYACTKFTSGGAGDFLKWHIFMQIISKIKHTFCHFASSDFFLMLSTQQLKESFHKFWQSTPHTSSCVPEHIFASLRATGQTSKSTDNEGHDRAGCVHIK